MALSDERLRDVLEQCMRREKGVYMGEASLQTSVALRALRTIATEAAREERERCAKVCEEEHGRLNEPGCLDCADAIAALGDEP